MLLTEKKFQKWAETLEMAIGNPSTIGVTLNSKRYFWLHRYLKTVIQLREVWNLCNAKLQEDFYVSKKLNQTVKC